MTQTPGLNLATLRMLEEDRPRSGLQERMARLFHGGFSVLDIAEPLHYVPYNKPMDRAREVLEAAGSVAGGVIRDGQIAGYVLTAELSGGEDCERAQRPFRPEEVLPETASLAEAVAALEEREYAFVSLLGRPDALVRRGDFEKPPARMWLFGMVTIQEMTFARFLRDLLPDGGWRRFVSEGRLAKAEQLREERARRNQPADLLDCLQYSEKAQILLKIPEVRERVGVQSKNEGAGAIKKFESLRNHLAHAQDITTYDWEAICLIAGRLDTILSRI